MKASSCLYQQAHRAPVTLVLNGGWISFERLSLRGGDEYGQQRLPWSASRLGYWSG